MSNHQDLLQEASDQVREFFELDALDIEVRTQEHMPTKKSSRNVEGLQEDWTVSTESIAHFEGERSVIALKPEAAPEIVMQEVLHAYHIRHNPSLWRIEQRLQETNIGTAITDEQSLEANRLRQILHIATHTVYAAYSLAYHVSVDAEAKLGVWTHIATSPPIRRLSVDEFIQYLKNRECRLLPDTFSTPYDESDTNHRYIEDSVAAQHVGSRVGYDRSVPPHVPVEVGVKKMTIYVEHPGLTTPEINEKVRGWFQMDATSLVRQVRDLYNRDLEIARHTLALTRGAIQP